MKINQCKKADLRNMAGLHNLRRGNSLQDPSKPISFTEFLIRVANTNSLQWRQAMFSSRQTPTSLDLESVHRRLCGAWKSPISVAKDMTIDVAAWRRRREELADSINKL